MKGFQKKPVHGVGINDSETPIRKVEIISGKRVLTWTCPFYTAWSGMLDRCYNRKKAINITYSDCRVCDEWLLFSNFKSWMQKQKWEVNQLDKYLLVKGNKVYSPDTCIFASRTVNTVLNDCRASRGNTMLGVHLTKKTGKFVSGLSVSGSKIHLGSFSNEIDAHMAWQKAKRTVILNMVETVSDERLKSAIMKRVSILEAGIMNGTEIKEL